MTLQRLRNLPARVAAFASLGERIELGLAELSSRIDLLSSKLELGQELPTQLVRDRSDPGFQEPYLATSPLVTICIATYNRPELLVSRAVRSALAQDYRNLQVLVVGDGCEVETERALAQVRDSRLSYHNLPERGRYPEAPEQRWMVAGTAAMNEALRRAEGHFITHLDDDDEHLPERVGRLLRLIREQRHEVAYHPFLSERQDGSWQLNPAGSFRYRAVSTGSIFYHRWYARIHWDIEAWRLNEPGDWNRLRKFLYLGATSVREPTPLLRHYRERSQRGR